MDPPEKDDLQEKLHSLIQKWEDAKTFDSRKRMALFYKHKYQQSMQECQKSIQESERESFRQDAQTYLQLFRQMFQSVQNVSVDLEVKTPEEYTDLGANNAHSKEGHENKLQLEKLLRENFTKDWRGFYSPKEEDNSELLLDLYRFTKIYDHDNDLKGLLAISMLENKCGDILPLQLLSSVIMRTYADRELLFQANNSVEQRDVAWNLITHYTSFYINYLNRTISIKEDDLPPLAEFNSYFDDIEQKSKHLNIMKKNFFNFKGPDVNALLLKYLINYFKIFKKHNIPFDPLVIHVRGTCSMLGKNNLWEYLCYGLGEALGTQQLSDLLKINYVDCFLISKNMFPQAIVLLKSVLGDEEDPNNPFQVPYCYNILSTALALNKQEREALEIVKKSESICSSPTQLWNKVFIKVSLGIYDDDLFASLKKLIDVSFDEWDNYDIHESNHKTMRSLKRRIYQYALIQANRTEELSLHIAEMQQESLQTALKKSRQKAAAIKKEREAKQVSQQPQALHVPKKKETTPLPIQPTGVFEEYYDCNRPSPRNNDLPKKEKKKTKGTADPNKATTQSSCLQPETNTMNFIFIENLTSNKNAQNTFNKLFDKYKNQIRSDKNVVISLNEINALFIALRQEFDPSKGKGSHKKVTLNFQFVNPTLEEQMITLTNKTYMKPEQIKALREGFINVGLVPNDFDLIERLKNEGYKLP